MPDLIGSCVIFLCISIFLTLGCLYVRSRKASVPPSLAGTLQDHQIAAKQDLVMQYSTTKTAKRTKKFMTWN